MNSKVLIFLMLFGFCLSYACQGEMVRLKDPTAAVYWSMGSTVLPSVPLIVTSSFGGTHNFMGPVGIGLCVAGVIVGPSMGHFYAGNYGRGFASIGFRTGVAGLGFLGIAGVVTSDLDYIEQGIIGTVIVGVTGIAVLASGIYDIWTCPNSVEEYNKSVQKYGGFYLAPEINVIDESYGLTLGYCF